MDGRTLHFHLFGINNQNFIMRDEETGSWWQQISGEAIQGPLKGRKLVHVPQDEISFALWKREHARGRVLRPDPKVAAAGHYAPADWESHIAKMPVATNTHDARLPPRELIIGVTVDGHPKAYRMADIRRQNPIVDSIGSVPVVIAVAEDGRSVRAFRRNVDGRAIELFAKPSSSPVTFIDSASGSEWDFAGRAISGPFAGHQLEKIDVLSDYWFDWRTYHPETGIFRVGLR
ncbi:MAG: hypothetical protein QOK37_2635 [Thermoanaerobaculia bacterium]|nr:hypothetical protein [Thermoanaerobaculia bacterium]